MEKLHDYKKINDLLYQNGIEKAYPLSIIEGFQSGEIFVDDKNKPGVALIWHYCGFANLLGNCDEKAMSEIYKMIHHPSEGHSGRMALQAEKDLQLQKLIMSDAAINEQKRYIFEFVNENITIPVFKNCELQMISGENYNLIKGKITPFFSWESEEQFLNNGFGYCLINDAQVLACAFSAAVSDKYIDIGVETSEEYRGKGYGKIVALSMVKEIVRRGRIPTWACDTMNEGSMRLAVSVGFKIIGTHPWYNIKSVPTP